MAAARPRTSAPTPRRSVRSGVGAVRAAVTRWFASPLRRGAAVTAVAATVAVATLWWTDRPAFAALPPAYWVMAAVAVGLDARPYVMAGRRATSVILPSICFTFAMALAWGLAPALAVQLGTVVVAGARIRQPARRTIDLALQHVAALGAVAVIVALAGVRIGAAEPRWTDVVLTVTAAAAWITARYGVASATRRCSSGVRAPHRPQRLGVELFATGALLLLGPVVLAAAQVSLALIAMVLLAVQAVHRLARAAGEQERAARRDALTGLANRRALQSAVTERADGRAARHPVALLLLDLDRFRTVNDALGHPHGDRLLRAVANRLTAAVPAHDLVVRLGGDEFAVLATRVEGPAAARRIAAHLAAALDEPFELDGLPVDVTASIGIALQPGHLGDGALLLRQAEVAMYHAKERGDEMALYAPDTDQHPQDRLTLLADLRRALEGGDPGITVYYQPQVTIGTGEVESVEALLRWRHPQRGMVDPEELIRVAEQTVVMRMLTGHVLAEVVQQLAYWRAIGRPVRAAVNVSVRDLHAGDIVEQVDDLLRDHGVPADLLQLEITESALMADPHRVLATITRLDRLGVAISLDDFGTGYSSLQHLRRLPLSEVKIDRSFVLGMAADAGDAAIVRSVIDLADALGLRVVAEGVEDERTWRLLHAAGCHTAQGWFYARPMPAEDLMAWLERYRPLRLGSAGPIALPTGR